MSGPSLARLRGGPNQGGVDGRYPSSQSPQPLLRVNFVACRCERTRGARAFATGGAPAGEAPASSGNEPGRARGKRSAGHRPDRSRREIRKGVNRAREDPRAAQRKTPNANRMDEGLASALLRAPPGGMGEDEQLTVVFVGAECAPWSKAGGLGDVMQVRIARRRGAWRAPCGPVRHVGFPEYLRRLFPWPSPRAATASSR